MLVICEGKPATRGVPSHKARNGDGVSMLWEYLISSHDLAGVEAMKLVVHITAKYDRLTWVSTGLSNGFSSVRCHQCWCLVECTFKTDFGYNGPDGVSNHQPRDCLLNRLFRRRSKKTSKLRVTGLCAGNSPGTGEFPAQMASNAEFFLFDDVIMQKKKPFEMSSILFWLRCVKFQNGCHCLGLCL